MMPPVFSLENIHRQYLQCRKNKRNTFFIKMDIQGFFYNINKEILYRIIEKRVRDEAILWLARIIIFHDCTKDVVFKGKKRLIEKVPAHKTLFNTKNRRGLPIGNLTSQYFANVYLDVLDQFVKHYLKAGYYIRYCDDFLLLDRERERLLEWREQIRKFLENRLLLTLNDGREAMGRITNGMDFLGYVVRPNYLLARRRVVNHLKEKLAAYQDRLISEQGDYTIYTYDTKELRGLMATWASYMAHLKMANTYRLRKTILNRFDWVGLLFQLKGEKLKMIPETPANLRSLKWQYRFFVGRCRGSILFFQVGRFFEFYDRQAEIAMGALGLQSMKDTRGFRIRCGFPVRYNERYLRKLIRLGFTIYIIREGEGWFHYLKKRRITEGWIPNTSTTNGRRRLGK